MLTFEIEPVPYISAKENSILPSFTNSPLKFPNESYIMTMKSNLMTKFAISSKLANLIFMTSQTPIMAILLVLTSDEG